MHRFYLFACLFLFAFSTTMVGQDRPTSREASAKIERLVEVELIDGQLVRGVFVSAKTETDAVVIQVSGATQTILLGDVKSIRFVAAEPATTKQLDTAPPPPPPAKQSTPPVFQGSTSRPVYNSRSVSVQCSGQTKRGGRCRRMTLSPNGRCWQHGGN